MSKNEVKVPVRETRKPRKVEIRKLDKIETTVLCNGASA